MPRIDNRPGAPLAPGVDANEITAGATPRAPHDDSHHEGSNDQGESLDLGITTRKGDLSLVEMAFRNILDAHSHAAKPVQLAQAGGSPATALPASAPAAASKPWEPPGPLVAGDRLALDVWLLPDQKVGSANLKIDASGCVELPWTGTRVKVAGLSADDAQAAIRAELATRFRVPVHAWVGVTEHKGQKIDPGTPTLPGETRRDAAQRTKLHEFEAYGRTLKDPTERGLFFEWVARHKDTDSFLSAEPHVVYRGLLDRLHARPEPRPSDAHWAFVDLKRKEIASLPPKERLTATLALNRYVQWLDDNRDKPDVLAKTNPGRAYGRIFSTMKLAEIDQNAAASVAEEKELRKTSPEMLAKKQAKLDEYWRVYHQLMERGHAAPRSNGPWLVITSQTEHDAYKVWAEEVMRQAYAHADDPDFVDSDPVAVAKRIRAHDPTVKFAMDVADRTGPIYEYHPKAGREPQSLSALAFEVLVGMAPISGEISDAHEAFLGKTITGYPLDTDERAAAAVFLLLPFLSGAEARAGKRGGEYIAQIAERTGRSYDEVEAMFRLVDNMPEADRAVIQHAWVEIRSGRKLTPEMAANVDRVVGKLNGPLEDLGVKTLARRRVDPWTGEVYKAGTPEHMQQRWFEYQAKNRDRFPKFSTEIEPQWRDAYVRALENRDVGSAFEDAALRGLGLDKNQEIFISPKGDVSFIPDGIKGIDGKSYVGEIKWGEPYQLVEVKNVKELSRTGNLKAEIEYVKNHGGHLTLVIRKDTKLSGPLADALEWLREKGRVTIIRE